MLIQSLLLAAAAPTSTPPCAVPAEVRIPSDPGTVLAGTLARPCGSAAPPVVVIVAGTGPWPRGGFADLRAGLLARGIATLEYDKRGVGQSTGAFVDTLPAMERDVAAAVAFLRTLHDIDTRHIALLGQSQGAVAVPEVAAHDPGIAAVVMLSGPVGPRGTLFTDILRANLLAGGRDPAGAERACAMVAAWLDARGGGSSPAGIRRRRQAAVTAFAAIGLPEAALAVLDTDVVLSMYEAAPDRALAAVHTPVLAVYGSADAIIAPMLSMQGATAALGANPDALVVVVPGATHEMRRSPETSVGTAQTGDGTVPVVIDTASTWLAKRLLGLPGS